MFSSYALHHLKRDEKASVVRRAVSPLRPDGWLLNAGIIASETKATEERIQDIRVDGIVERARGADPRFRDRDATRGFLDELEANEDDKPLTLRDDLQVLRDAGLRDVDVFWLEYREAVVGGRK